MWTLGTNEFKFTSSYMLICGKTLHIFVCTFLLFLGIIVFISPTSMYACIVLSFHKLSEMSQKSAINYNAYWFISKWRCNLNIKRRANNNLSDNNKHGKKKKLIHEHGLKMSLKKAWTFGNLHNRCQHTLVSWVCVCIHKLAFKR